MSKRQISLHNVFYGRNCNANKQKLEYLV